MNRKKEFNRIIIPVDGSEISKKAAKKGFFLAKNTGLETLVLYVVDVKPFTGILPPDEVYNIWKKAIEGEGQKTLDEMIKISKEMDVNVKTLMIPGKPDEEIIKEVKKNDLVIMGHKGKAALDKILIGSISEKVLHHANATIMIVR